MNNRFFKFLIATLCFILIFTATSIFTVFAETATPISTKEQLNNIRNNLSGNYYLTNDIIFTEDDFKENGAFYNEGKGFVPIGTDKSPFTGTFDGKGHSISGLKIAVSGSVYTVTTALITKENSGSGDDWTGDYPIPPYNPIPTTVSPTIGLFGSNSGTISNVAVLDSSISGTSINNVKLYIGGIVGHNKGAVSNCMVQASITGTELSYSGGIVGFQSKGSISNCVSFANITSTGFFAGIAGAVAVGTVTTSYSDSTFSGTKAAAFNIASHTLTLGGYYIADTDYNGLGNKISTADANKTEAYTGFDFTNTWYMDSTVNRPMLLAYRVSPVKMGDIDGDSNINLNDVVALAQYVADWDVDIVVDAANVNKDKDSVTGKDIINLNDVVYLAQYVAGWEGIVL